MVVPNYPDDGGVVDDKKLEPTRVKVTPRRQLAMATYADAIVTVD